MKSELVRLFLATFASVFVAELGDKTQLATMSLAGGADAATTRWVIFFGASMALVLTSAIGVLVGAAVGKVIAPSTLRIVGGLGFVAMGGWMLLGKG